MGMRSIGRLSARKFEKLSVPGRLCDGGGLYLQISKSGARSWIFRFQLNGKVRDMGLGSASALGLANARNIAAKCQALVANEIDPVEDREQKRQRKAFEIASAVTFKECALSLIQAKKKSWRNPKHAAQWPATQLRYAQLFCQ